MNLEHKENRLVGRKNHRLYYQSWLPSGRPKATLVVVHGLGEHSGRYGNVVNHFVPRGYATYGMDHWGHGKSEGTRVYADRFTDYLDDLEIFLARVRQEQPAGKIFMLGHSVGGTIATAYAIGHQDDLAGLMLSAPALQVGASVSRLSLVMARMLSHVMPKLGISPLDSSAMSSDPGVVQAYLDDPLVHSGKITARLGAELVNAIEKWLPARIAQIRVPVLVMYGTADRLSNPDGSEMFCQKVGSADKTLKRYEGLYHEIFNEPRRQQVFRDMEVWLDARV